MLLLKLTLYFITKSIVIHRLIEMIEIIIGWIELELMLLIMLLPMLQLQPLKLRLLRCQCRLDKLQPEHLLESLLT